MISNTELFFAKLTAFQDKRAKLVDDYEKAAASLEKFKGSSGYTEEMQKLKEKHKQQLEALIGEYRPGIMAVIEGMRDAIGRRSLPAPTAEQVNVLNVLRMRKKLTQDDVSRCAESLRGCRLALDALAEIAAEHGLHHNGFDSLAAEISTEAAERVVQNLRDGTEDFLKHDTKRAPRIARSYFEERYGVDENARPLPKRERFTDRASCFETIAGINAEALEMLAPVLNGETA